MKTTTIAFSAASVLLISLFAISVFKIGLAAALTDATSTIIGSTTAPALPDTENASTTPVVVATTTEATSSSTAAAPITDNATSTAATSTPPAVSATSKPKLKLVHVAGSKYIDYFTDGTATYSFPGDPAIDANLNKPDAAIPFHNGLTWVSSKGMEAYDTASGDLEPGTYAQEADGSFIANASDAADATSSTNAHLSFSKLDPTLDVSAPAPAAASGTSTASAAPTDLDTPATVPASDASTTPVAPVASTTPSIPPATTTPLASSASSATTSSTTSPATNDNAASSTSATSTAQ